MIVQVKAAPTPMLCATSRSDLSVASSRVLPVRAPTFANGAQWTILMRGCYFLVRSRMTFLSRTRMECVSLSHSCFGGICSTRRLGGNVLGEFFCRASR